MNSEAFKAEVKGHLERAIASNGGLSLLQQRYREIPSTCTFLAGWVCAAMTHDRAYKAVMRGSETYQDALRDFTKLSAEAIRRVHDLTRLALESQSTTS